MKTKNSAKFIVAVCTRNRYKFFLSLLKDFKKQTIVPYQYIFVENIKEKQLLSHKKIFEILKHPRIEYLTTTGNKAVALNICLKRVKYNPIIFFDDDIHIKNNVFEKIINAFETIPGATAFSTRTLHVRSDVYSCFNNYWYNLDCLNSFEPLVKTIAPTTIYCLNLDKIKKHKILFKEKYNFSDDLDFFCQLKRHNLSLCYLPNIVSHHFFGNRNNLIQFLKRFYQYGFDSYTISVEYPDIIYNSWLLPSRKFHFIFFPFFFINKVIKQTKTFICNNPKFPLSLYPITFLVFCFFDIGIYKSFFMVRNKR